MLLYLCIAERQSGTAWITAPSQRHCSNAEPPECRRHGQFHLQEFSAITPSSGTLSNETGKGDPGADPHGMRRCPADIAGSLFQLYQSYHFKILKRAKEIGLRKIIGAKRSQVFMQCMLEAVLLSLIALLFAWMLLAVVVRFAPFNDGYEFIPSTFQYNFTLISLSVAFALFTGMVARRIPSMDSECFQAPAGAEESLHRTHYG